MENLQPAPPPLPKKDPFSWRNWGRNGWASRIAVFLSILMILNLFQPWEADFSGSGYTTTERGTYYKTTTYHQGAKFVGKANAFDKKLGWIPFLLLAGTIYICGKPKAGWGGWRWLPLLTSIVIFAISFDELRDLQAEMNAWTASLSSKPFVQMPAAVT